MLLNVILKMSEQKTKLAGTEAQFLLIFTICAKAFQGSISNKVTVRTRNVWSD